ncbi:arsenate reductase (glutaredoxin) [Celerinatantimonas sp. YJH-8]|uniref:arsenate reductase (glutaredoxin) n=1 Tax=Celerinatantimonas sp. YJH-8 TaxID=3228714 RepID=UPI0038C9CFF0
MSEITIYHNPRCSKSRETLKLLEQQGITPTIIEYLKTPPDAATLKGLLQKLGYSPMQLMRQKESLFTELNIADQPLSDAELIDIMIAHPKLIERPIVVHGNKAIIGRPPEQVLTIL